MRVDADKPLKTIFIKNFIGGVAWALGITFGFAVFTWFIGFIVDKLGGLPLIGDFIASLIESTQRALEYRSY